MIKSENFKAFRGTMCITPPNPAYTPYNLHGDWIYKPEYNCWYGCGRSFAESLCKIVEDETDGTLTANQYQLEIMRTLNGIKYHDDNDKLNYSVLGLNGETGEVTEIVKKYLYHGHTFDKEHYIEELGDVLAYIVLGANSIGITLEEVMQKNIEKIKKRYPDGFSFEKSINRKC